MSGATVAADTRLLARLTLALGFTQLTPLLTSIGLAMIVARLGAKSFSAYMLVASINLTTTIAAGALIQALFVVGGRAIGLGRSQDYDAARRATWWIAAGAGALCAIASLCVGPALLAGHIELMLAESAGRLAPIIAIGLPPALFTMVLRVHAALYDRVQRVTALYVFGGICTLALAGLGAAWGGLTMVGFGIALGSWLQFGMGLLLLDDPADDVAPPRPSIRPAFDALWRVGWPVALVVFMDTFASSSSTLIVARFWPSMVPAHSAMLLVITVGLVLPLGLGLAALQVVAVTDARGGAAEAAVVARRAIGAALGYGVVVIAVAVVIDRFAAVPLLVPGALLLAIQSVILVAAAVLRSAGLIRAPLISGAVGYVLLSVGGAVLFGVAAGYGIAGVWGALILGFGFTALAVLHRALTHFAKPPFTRASVEPVAPFAQEEPMS